MNWIALILQVFSARKALHDSQDLILKAQLLAERGKRTLVSIVVLATAALFFFSGFLLAIINLGLQIERDGAISYSGLMVSSTILVAIALMLAGTSYLLGRSNPAPRNPPEEKIPPGENRIKDLLEEFLVNFLAQLVKKNSPSAAPAQEPEKPKQN